MKLTLTAALVLTILTGAFSQPIAKQSDQGIFAIPFASASNTIELEVANSTEIAKKDVSVRLSNAPEWLVFEEGSFNIGVLGSGESQTAVFSFDLDERAPVGEVTDLAFDVASAEGTLQSHSIRIEAEAPTELMLRGNYPNPFNPTTKIAYALPEDSNVAIEVFNAIGQHVARIVDRIQEAGYQEASWNASGFPSGLYFYSIEFNAQGHRQVKVGKMLLVR